MLAEIRVRGELGVAELEVGVGGIDARVLLKKLGASAQFRRLADYPASARVTASGSFSTILSRMRALRSGLRRPCSQSRTAETAKP